MSKSIAAPQATPLTVFDEKAPYPFEEIIGRDEEERELRSWLLAENGAGGPLGGAALVTGFRGVGKTSLVNKVLFDVGLAALHGVDAQGSDWGPFDAEARARFKKAPGAPKRVVVPVYVDIARSISAEALLRRIVRRVYFALVAHGVGALDPRLVRSSRATYLRSLGEMSVETTERIKASVGIDVQRLSTMSLAVDTELELAEAVRQVVGQLSVEEAEDEVLDVFAATSSPLGARRFWERTKELGNTPVIDLITAMTKKMKDNSGVRVHPVLVLDELDKLEPPPEPVRDRTGKVSGSVGGGHIDIPSQFMVDLQWPTAPEVQVDDRLTSASEVVRLLKSLFSSRHLSAIAIGGWQLEDEWIAEQGEIDPMLRSVFSRHVYVRSARPQHLSGFVPDEWHEYVALRTRGRYKDAIRVATELERDYHAALRERLGTRLEGWGTFDARELASEASPAVKILEDAKSLEQLVQGVSGGLPPTRANRFGVDYVRAVLAGRVLAYAHVGADRNALLRAVRGDSERESSRVASPLLEQALRTLVDWLHPSSSTDAAKAG